MEPESQDVQGFEFLDMGRLEEPEKENLRTLLRKPPSRNGPRFPWTQRRSRHASSCAAETPEPPYSLPDVRSDSEASELSVHPNYTSSAVLPIVPVSSLAYVDGSVGMGVLPPPFPATLPPTLPHHPPMQPEEGEQGHLSSRPPMGRNSGNKPRTNSAGPGEVHHYHHVHPHMPPPPQPSYGPMPQPQVPAPPPPFPPQQVPGASPYIGAPVFQQHMTPYHHGLVPVTCPDRNWASYGHNFAIAGSANPHHLLYSVMMPMYSPISAEVHHHHHIPGITQPPTMPVPETPVPSMIEQNESNESPEQDDQEEIPQPVTEQEQVSDNVVEEEPEEQAVIEVMGQVVMEDQPPVPSDPILDETVSTEVPLQEESETSFPESTQEFTETPAPSVEAILTPEAGDDEFPQLHPPTTTQMPAKKSWASLFANKEPRRTPEPPSPAPSVVSVAVTETAASPPKPMARVGPFVNNTSNGTHNGSHSNGKTNVNKDDPLHCKLSEHLSNYTLDHRTVSLMPRGLVNRSNWCYVNATLQALLACPPFYNFIRSLPVPRQGRLLHSLRTALPVISSMIEFVSDFTPMARTNRREKSSAQANKENSDSANQIQTGITFEPNCVYRMLNCIRNEDSFNVEGRQEDAEEFLSCLLNGLQDEMVELMGMNKTPPVTPHPVLTNGVSAPNGTLPHMEEEDSHEWKVTRSSRKGTACITHKTDFVPTPLSKMFGGQMRTAVHQAGAQPTANLQSFYTLQLDIQSDKVESVKDALDGLVSREALEGYTCARTRQEVEASRQATLEELPCILILHLKRFIYDHKSASGPCCQKLLKRVDFGVDLELSKDLLSQSARSKYTQKQRFYKLFAVVYHDGKEASKGHYVTDVYHSGCGGWVRFDDSLVKSVPDSQLLKHSPPRVPYLLYYRRGDTLSPPR